MNWCWVALQWYLSVGRVLSRGPVILLRRVNFGVFMYCVAWPIIEHVSKLLMSDLGCFSCPDMCTDALHITNNNPLTTGES